MVSYGKCNLTIGEQNRFYIDGDRSNCFDIHRET